MASTAVCLAEAAIPRFLLSSPAPLPIGRRFSSLPFHIPLLHSRGAPLLAVGAGLNLPKGFSAAGNVETDRLPSDVRNRAMEAADSYGGRVTIGDVSGRSGLKVNEAERALQALAADTGGFLEVSDEGDVLYILPNNYRSKLAAKSFRMKLEPLIEKLKDGAVYLIRVSFGTALIASIVLVYTTIIALLSSRSEDDNRGRRGGRSYNSGFNFFIRPSDLFWYWDPYYYRRQQMRSTDEGMNFVESVFSFVFGDGNPNQGIEEERWKLIGQYISSNGGVVAAEELAPYLDLPENEKSEDESYILPVLLRFDGNPQVDEGGNILYSFPSLQRTASAQRVGRREYVGKRSVAWVDGVEKFFKERKWTFSKTKASERAMVAALGGLNLFGVIVLGAMLKNAAVTPRGLISFVSDIFPVLQVYAASFFAIPLFRWFLVRRNNGEIEKKNLARQQRAKALEIPNSVLRQKLISARDLARKTVFSSDKAVYSTNKNLADQDYEIKEWERKFDERNV